MSGQSYSLNELAKKVNGEVIGDSSLQISSIGTIQHSSSGCITFLANPKYKKYLNKTSASAIIVSPEFKDKIKVCKMDVDANRETAAEYGIRSIPTLMIFENGELVGTEIGALSKLQLEEFIRSKI